MSRREEVIGEVEMLLGTDWPPNIARRLGYSDTHALQHALHNWDRDDLARSFRKAVYDGLSSNSHRTAEAHRQGAVV